MSEFRTATILEQCWPECKSSEIIAVSVYEPSNASLKGPYEELDGRVLTAAEAEPLLNHIFEDEYGEGPGVAVTIWTSSHIYRSYFYDTKHEMFSVEREPPPFR